MKRFQNIVFVKSARNDERAFARAVALAKQNHTGLTLVKVIEDIRESVFGVPGEMLGELEREILTSCKESLEHLVEPHRKSVQIEIRILEGIPFIAITRDVLRNQRDLIIKSADDDFGPMARLFGSADMHLLRKCPCPIWLMKPDQPEKISRIVAAVDLDEFDDEEKNTTLNKQILELAISLAHREGAELHVVHAWQAIAETALKGMRSNMTEKGVSGYVSDIKASHEHRFYDLMRQARDWVGKATFDSVAPFPHIIKGPAQKVVTELAGRHAADLLVMGTVGRTGIPGFIIGNTAETILGGIDCSVLAVKPAGFVSPVEVPVDRRKPLRPFESS